MPSRLICIERQTIIAAEEIVSSICISYDLKNRYTDQL